jgi:phosphate transport system substrate-binding protein
MGNRFAKFRQLTVAAVIALVTATPAMAERVTVGGTGAAIEFLRRLSSEFGARSGVEVEVISSMGSSGALRAVADGALDIAVSALPLNEEMTAKGLSVAYTFKTPFLLVTSQPRPPGMSLAEVIKAYRSPTSMWPDGEPIRVILRPKLDSDTLLMEALFPGLGDAMAAARQRPDVPIAATDQDNGMLAERTPGSLVGMTWLQAKAEKRNLRFIAIDGVEPMLENFDRGLYRHAKMISFVVTTQPKPATRRFMEFVQSSAGEDLLRRTVGY